MANNLVSTGIGGLDEVLGGGIPEGRIIVILGGPGTGKTILATHFLLEGFRSGETGVFISLDESKHHYYREMEKFGWTLKDYEDKKKFVFISASPIKYHSDEMTTMSMKIGVKEFSIRDLAKVVNSSVRDVDAKRIVVDSIASLILQYPSLFQRRIALLELIEILAETGATCLLNSELQSMSITRKVQVEEYLAHGVIVLQSLKAGNSIVRVLQVEKMRENDVEPQPRPYRITTTGIEVYPKETVF